MYTLAVMNLTLGEYSSAFQVALIVEWALLGLNFLENTLVWYMIHFTSQYHPNLSLIFEQLSNQYFVSLLSRMFIIYMQIIEPNLDVLLENRYFLFATWLRNSLLFTAFYCAPFLVFERVFATYYMRDYETNQRRWISYIIVALFYVYPISMAQIFIFEENSRQYQIFVIALVNFIAFLLTIYLGKYNKMKYDKLRKSLNSKYSLSARTQLAENINSSRPFQLLCLLVALFSLLSSSLLHIDEFTSDEYIKNVAYVVFNICCWSYGTFVPIILLFFNKMWQKEMKSLLNKMTCQSSVEPQLVRPTTTKVADTFGNNCYVADSMHTDVYFSQFNAEW
ncbi:unnamed protein product [Caenorhabditis bovis]|uniref:Uncharacterized protein n=1 Tax=Caenorhabditis bovis TaxID=2654633 RepID=A0A8S1F258_9PELO|nr:unnamed protein product [Caenorhabditis bovis]